MLKKALYDWTGRDSRDWEDVCFEEGYRAALKDVQDFLEDNFQSRELMQAIARFDDIDEEVGN